MGNKSYISPKTKVKKRKIQGLGLFAIRLIKKGEIVAIKGGHIMDSKTLEKVEDRIEDSYIDKIVILSSSKDYLIIINSVREA